MFSPIWWFFWQDAEAPEPVRRVRIGKRLLVEKDRA